MCVELLPHALSSGWRAGYPSVGIIVFTAKVKYLVGLQM